LASVAGVSVRVVARTDGSRKIVLRYLADEFGSLGTLRTLLRIDNHLSRLPARILQVVACRCGNKGILRYSSKDVEHG